MTTVLIRQSTFETNSSSCHSLAVKHNFKNEKLRRYSFPDIQICQEETQDFIKKYIPLGSSFVVVYGYSNLSSGYRTFASVETSSEKLGYVLSNPSNWKLNHIQSIFTLFPVDYILFIPITYEMGCIVLSANETDSSLQEKCEAHDIYYLGNEDIPTFYFDTTYEITVNSHKKERKIKNITLTDLIFLDDFSFHHGNDNDNNPYKFKGASEFQYKESLLNLKLIKFLLNNLTEEELSNMGLNSKSKIQLFNTNQTLFKDLISLDDKNALDAFNTLCQKLEIPHYSSYKLNWLLHGLSTSNLHSCENKELEKEMILSNLLGSFGYEILSFFEEEDKSISFREKSSVFFNSITRLDKEKTEEVNKLVKNYCNLYKQVDKIFGKLTASIY